MSYTPPSYNAANIAFITDPAYTPPGSNAVNLEFVYSSGTSLYLTGSEATVSKGSLAKTIAAILSGRSSTLTPGTLTPTFPAGATLTGRAVTIARGALAQSLAIQLTGRTATTSEGSFVKDLAAVLTGHSATLSGSSLAVEIDYNVTRALTGNAVTSDKGILAKVLLKALGGRSIASGVGAITNTQTTAVTGASATLSRGDIADLVTAALSGGSLTASKGAVAYSRAVSLSGNGFYGETGDVNCALIEGDNVTCSISGKSVRPVVGGLGKTSVTGVTGIAGTLSKGAVIDVISSILAGRSVSSGLGGIGDTVGGSLEGRSVSAASGNLVVQPQLQGSGITVGRGQVASTLGTTLLGSGGATSFGSVLADLISRVTGNTSYCAKGDVAPAASIDTSGLQLTGNVGAVVYTVTWGILGHVATLSVGEPVFTQGVTLLPRSATLYGGALGKQIQLIPLVGNGVTSYGTPFTAVNEGGPGYLLIAVRTDTNVIARIDYINVKTGSVYANVLKPNDVSIIYATSTGRSLTT